MIKYLFFLTTNWFLMDSKGQSGLEYLMTYGWALILIATVIGVLVFIVSTPASEVIFSSSEPNKIMLKGGTVSGTIAEIKLQNITGGNLEVTSITGNGDYSGCTVNGFDPPGDPSVSVSAGGQLLIECTSTSPGNGTVALEYTDFANLSRTVIITGGGGTSGGGGGGTPDGTPSNPFEITSCAELQAISDLSAHYVMTQSFSCSGLPHTPIGTIGSPFTGGFDGGNFIISAIDIDTSPGNYIGLFGRVNTSSEIKDLTLSNLSITGGDNYIGGLIGYFDSGTVSNCTVSSPAIDGNDPSDYVGGLVGYNNSGTITGSGATNVTINGLGYIGFDVGGIAGYNGGTITGATVSGTVYGNSYVGGIIGYNANGGTLTDTLSASATADASFTAGGLVGENAGAIVNSSTSTDSYGDPVGGLVGEQVSGGSISGTSSWGGINPTNCIGSINSDGIGQPGCTFP